MSEARTVMPTDFEEALKIGRPPNVVKLFPNSKALIVSGKFIDRAMLTKDGNFIKVKGHEVTEEMWKEMTAYAESKGIKGGNDKKLNMPFEINLMGQPKAVRERMIKRIEEFLYNMLVNVFNVKDTASLAINAILEAGTHDQGPKTSQIENPAINEGEVHQWKYF